jgi:hypothetical protein
MTETATTPAPMREAKGKRREISEEMRRWADSVIVPALVREYLAERGHDNELVPMEGLVPECRTVLTAKETL